MSLLTRWDPRQDIQEFENRLSSWMGRAPITKELGKESMRVMEWAPLVDITEDDKEYVIKADLPEIKKGRRENFCSGWGVIHLRRTEV